jgi:hypothetical protein
MTGEVTTIVPYHVRLFNCTEPSWSRYKKRSDVFVYTSSFCSRFIAASLVQTHWLQPLSEGNHKSWYWMAKTNSRGRSYLPEGNHKLTAKNQLVIRRYPLDLARCYHKRRNLILARSCVCKAEVCPKRGCKQRWRSKDQRKNAAIAETKVTIGVH